MLPNLPTTLPPSISLRLLKAHLRAGHLSDARKLFDTIPHPDVRLWTILISAYARRGLPAEAIGLYRRLLQANRPHIDKFALLPAALACAHASDLCTAKEVHADAVQFGFHKDTMLGNAMIHMYGKCGSPQCAKTVFDELPYKDVVSWTSLIAACASSNALEEALRVFREMARSTVSPNSVTVSSVLPVCSNLKSLNCTREIHAFAVRNGLAENVFVSSALADSYAKCSSPRSARIIFDNVCEKDTVSWNVILGAYFSNGECDEALDLFSKMEMEDQITDCSTWNTVIGGCVQNARIEHAFDLLHRMQKSGLKPNNMTIASILPACISSESLRGGKEMHGYCARNMLLGDMIIVTALIFMYSKCGDLDVARFIFEEMPRKDMVAWNTAILANSMHGCGKEALTLFKRMVAAGVKPNSVTMMAVLSGCSHAQFVDEGRHIFNSMYEDYRVRPDVDHYSCMVDILCRAGCLQEAYEFIQNMPLEPSAGAWGALLAGSRVYKNSDLGEIAANRLFEIEPNNPGNYILLSNIYVAAKQWDKASRIRKLMRDKGITKDPGCSWIEVKNKIHTFVKGDRRSAHSWSIYGFLKEIREKMKRDGYSPDTEFVLQDVDEEEKEEVLCDHSEKLAVAFGILNSNGKSSIRVFKNLRICGDCHSVIKFISRDVGIHIVVRDSMRFHHFRCGSCSCGDVW